MTSFLPDTTSPATLLSRRFRPEDIPNLTGRIALVTGGSAGIGYYDAFELASAGAKVFIVSASEERGKKAEAEINKAIKEKGSTGHVSWIGVDLGKLKEVDAVAKKLMEEERLDIVICNAGVGQAPFGMTDDGLERHFEVNVLSHYVLLMRLLPLMKKTATNAPPATVRIVMQSSEMHRVAPGDTQFLSKEEINKERDGSQLYGRTKLALIYLARELAKRKLSDLEHGSGPILVMSVHPGTVDTEVQKAWSESYGKLGQVLEWGMKKVGKSAPEGAEASLWAATCTNITETNWNDFQGNYYTEAHGTPDQESKQAQDSTVAGNCWELCASLSKELLGEELR